MKKKYVIIFLLFLSFGCGNIPDFENRMQTETPRVPRKEYHQNDPGEWAGMEHQHAPQVTIIPGAVENVVIRVNLPVVREPDHYIEKIGIMDQNGNDIFVKNFNPNADYFEARFKIPNIGPGYKAFAKCSQHDLWTAPLE